MSRCGRVLTAVASAVSAAIFIGGVSLGAETVVVRHTEGTVHGFLVLRTTGGTAVADGDLIQTVHGGRVTARIVFHFKDGSLHDDTAVYTQAQQFQLVSDHLVQKGPAFSRPLDMTIDATTGQVVVRYTDEHGVPKEKAERMKLPPDLANGLVLTLLKNVSPGSLPKAFSYVAATPDPRLVKLALSSAGANRFDTGSHARDAEHYVLKVDIGGVAGVIAPIVGKEPPDSQVWILEGDAPAFVKAEQQLSYGGPMYRIELLAPNGP
jgi:hypothetical protein